jgi:hypothetical protein
MWLELITRVHAQTNTQVVEIKNPLSSTSFTDLVGKLITAILTIAAPIAVVMILVGAFQIMTANGSEEGVTNGKNTIKYAIVGFAIIVMSQVAVDIIKSILSP